MDQLAAWPKQRNLRNLIHPVAQTPPVGNSCQYSLCFESISASNCRVCPICFGYFFQPKRGGN